MSALVDELAASLDLDRGTVRAVLDGVDRAGYTVTAGPSLVRRQWEAVDALIVEARGNGDLAVKHPDSPDTHLLVQTEPGVWTDITIGPGHTGRLGNLLRAFGWVHANPELYP